jgi:tRNA (guanine-N7-)-methyltransferase
MPHVLVKNFTPPTLPITKDEITFVSMSTLYKKVGLIEVEIDLHRFYLRYYERPNGILIKYDKATRIAELNPLKKAINSFAELCKAEIIESNTTINKPDRVYAHHKKLAYFLNDFHQELKPNQKVWIEVGFGSGIHLVHNAKNNPDVMHVGIEIHKPSAEQLLKQCHLEQINNILVIDTDARTFLEVLPSNSVQKVFVHFPVPWDKAEHRRVISKRFVNETSRILEEKGVLNLRTDSENYAYYSRDVLMSDKIVDLYITKNIDIAVKSKYETRWQKMDKNIYDFTLTNHESHEDKRFDYNFSFNRPILFQHFLDSLKETTFVEEDYLLHIQERFPYENGAGIIKLTMGVKGAPHSLYIVFDSEGAIRYFPHHPLPISANIAAHEHLLKVLSNATNHTS